MRTSLIGISIFFLMLLCLQVPAVQADPANLLQNAGAEDGAAGPDVWRSLALSPADVAFSWEKTVVNSGRRSLGIEVSKPSIGMWQQTVPVVPGQLYLLTGNVAFQGVALPESCRLQIVFRDAVGIFLNLTDFPGHSGTRWFALDFPAKLKVRAPQDAAFAEINCILASTGRAWFDDLFFGPAPAGRIVGTVSSAGTPLPWAHVFIWGDPWGRRMEAVTGPDGLYAIEDVPAAFPRYMLLAEAQGRRTQAQGRIEVKENDSVQVDFDLPVGSNPKDDLRVKFGMLESTSFAPPPSVPADAVIAHDASGYPDAVGAYLQADECIQSDHPDIVRQAEKILQSLPSGSRRNTRAIAWAVYEWIAKNIEHDGVFFNTENGLKQPFKDVTSGMWQSTDEDGWGFGRSMYDWAYKPHELLQTKNGICIEQAWLAAALLRALNIPARSSVGAVEFWAQDRNSNGAWIGMGPNAGRTSYRKTGSIEQGFENTMTQARFSALSRPVLQADWDAWRGGLWRERHPWGASYAGDAAGYAQALADLAEFAETGEAPAGTPVAPSSHPPEKSYEIHYSDITINLYNMTEQRFLDVRFPLVMNSDAHSATGDYRYWTNHPEAVLATWIEDISNPPVLETEHWFHIAFDLSFY